MARTKLEDCLRASPRVMSVLRAARSVDLPDHRLVSGAVYQTAWNVLTGRHPDYGIAYFAPSHSEVDEQEWQELVRNHVAAELRPAVEVVNQARVHLWFEGYFGRPFTPLTDTDSALERFLSTVHAVGVRLEPDGSMSIAAPYGLDDVFSLTIRPNPSLNLIDRHLEKAAGVLKRWPEARVLA